MILGAHRYSKTGRIRFGSSIFIDDLKEQHIDTLRGESNNNIIKFVLVFLAILKIISGNGIGLIFSLGIFYTTYYLAVKKHYLHFTKERLLIITEYKFPRLTTFLGYILILSAIYTGIAVLRPEYAVGVEYNLIIMNSIFNWFGLIPIFIVGYDQYVFFYETRLFQFDSLLSIFIYSIHGYQLINIKYKFSEIHLSHITEETISLAMDHNGMHFTIFLLLTVFIQTLIASGFNFILLLISIIAYRYSQKKVIAYLSLYGSYGRRIMQKIIIQDTEFNRCLRTTAAIFNWIPQGDYHSRPFPYNVIPREIASHYPTGLRASIKEALYQANLVGLIFSGIINVIVIGILGNFAIKKNRNELGLVFIILISLIIVSFLIWEIFAIITNYQYNYQKEEALMIGPEFVGRYIEPTLWLIRGNKLEGTRTQRGVSRKLVRYDKRQGLIIAWRSLGIYFIALGLIGIIFLWMILGALNPTNAVYVFPFLFDQWVLFLSKKASTELGFYLLFGYLFWIGLYLYYPRFYASSRPQVFLELQYPVTIPIILKNSEDHNNASIQFTKCLINSARPKRRFTQGRPGAFIIDVYLLDYSILEDDDFVYYIELGESQRQTKNLREIQKTNNKLLISNMQISGISAYPKLRIRLMRKDEITQEVFLVLDETFELEKNEYNMIDLRFDEFNQILLKVDVKYGEN